MVQILGWFRAEAARLPAKAFQRLRVFSQDGMGYEFACLHFVNSALQFGPLNLALVFIR
jgi:hypothetical protein